MRKQNKGFTLLEIILVIAAIGILAAIVLVAINPNRQLEAARNAKRRADINTITKAIQQYSIDNKGQYPTGIDIGAKAICRNGTPVGCIDLSNILAPTYVASIPEPDSNNYYVRRSNNSIEISHPRDTIWNIGGTPSLDLNFAKNKSLIDGVSGNNLISFTRAETTPTANSSTYVGEDGLIKTAAANEPRFDHNPLTGESLGLLVEEQRTNIIVSTQSFNSGGWNQNGVSLTANSTIAPDGTNTATSIVSGTGSNRTFHFDNTGAGNKTLTIFAKSNAGNSITLSGNLNYGTNNSGAVTLNTSNGTISTATGCSSVAFPNGWYRFIIPINVSFGAGNTNYLQLNGPVDSIYIWGAQIEAGSFPTSYIPTTNTAVTRPADVATITGTNFSNWFTPTVGSFFTDSSNDQLKNNIERSTYNSANTVAFSLGSGAGRVYTPILSYLSNNTINARLFQYNGGATEWGPDLQNTISNTTNVTKVSMFTDITNNLAGLSTAGQVNIATKPLDTTRTGETSYSLAQSIVIGYNSNYRGNYIGRIKRLTYWPTRLPNAALQSLTQ